MLWQLFHATDLAEAAALVLGEFTECSGFRMDWIVRACEMWAPKLPVFSGFPCGHGQANLVFRFGGECRIGAVRRLSLLPCFGMHLHEAVGFPEKQHAAVCGDDGSIRRKPRILSMKGACGACAGNCFPWRNV
jgi:hypothetical protein